MGPAALSQCISNVPAAVMLSGFTENANALLLGVNLGGWNAYRISGESDLLSVLQ
ncbi:MAG: hypothetical protein ACLSFT_05460 [Ruminococcus callidus]